MSNPLPGEGGDDRARRGGFSAHSVRLAWILALAYLLVVAYASVQPLRGWRMPPPEVLAFLVAPWPRWITLEDLAVNVAAYAPLGFLLSIAFSARCGTRLGVLAASAAAVATSLAMETIQMFLPARIASNVDVLTNGLGGVLGAMAAPLFAPARAVGGRVHALRHRLFVPGMAADIGLVLVVLWVLAQLDPAAPLFGIGALRATLHLRPYFEHSPQLAFGAEAAVVLFNLTGAGLLLAALARARARPMALAAAAAGAALLAKTLSAALLVQAPKPLSWLTPGASVGLLAGALLLWALARVPHRAKLALAAACIAAATVAINAAPENPYQSPPAQLVGSGASHFLSFSAIVRALSELWPLLALAFLLHAFATRSLAPARPHGEENPTAPL
jgi:VanZ family protein